MSSSLLNVDWCSWHAAKAACVRWHYSASMPAGKAVKIGVWERGVFKGAVIFSYGSNQFQGRAFSITQQEVCELTRVALGEHETPVTRILAIAIRMLRKHCPGLRLIVSYADTDQGHHGGIYAAGGWVYVGQVEANGKATPMYLVHGKKCHGRTLSSRGYVQNIDWIRRNVDPRAEKIIPGGKHKYYFPLDPGMASALKPLAKPYPKRPKAAGACDQ